MNIENVDKLDNTEIWQYSYYLLIEKITILLLLLSFIVIFLLAGVSVRMGAEQAAEDADWQYYEIEIDDTDYRAGALLRS